MSGSGFEVLHNQMGTKINKLINKNMQRDRVTRRHTTTTKKNKHLNVACIVGTHYMRTSLLTDYP